MLEIVKIAPEIVIIYLPILSAVQDPRVWTVHRTAYKYGKCAVMHRVGKHSAQGA